MLVIDTFVTLCCRCGVVAPFFHFGTSFVRLGLWPSFVRDFGLRRSEFGVWRSAFGVRRSEFGVWSLEFGVWSLEFGVWSLEFGVGALQSVVVVRIFSLFGVLVRGVVLGFRGSGPRKLKELEKFLAPFSTLLLFLLYFAAGHDVSKFRSCEVAKFLEFPKLQLTPSWLCRQTGRWPFL